jgi:hypothetical protein
MDASRQADYQRVAQLHAANIDQGFLSTLGPRFLRLLYQAIDECPGACLLLAREGGQVVGFVAGTLNMGPVYRRLLRHWLALGLSLAPSLLIPRRLWRILEILVIEVHRGLRPPSMSSGSGIFKPGWTACWAT